MCTSWASSPRSLKIWASRPAMPVPLYRPSLPVLGAAGAGADPLIALSKRDFGPMAKFETYALENGPTAAELEADKSIVQSENASKATAWEMIIPLLVMFVTIFVMFIGQPSRPPWLQDPYCTDPGCWRPSGRSSSRRLRPSQVQTAASRRWPVFIRRWGVGLCLHGAGHLPVRGGPHHRLQSFDRRFFVVWISWSAVSFVKIRFST